MNSKSLRLTPYGSRFLLGGNPSDIEQIRNCIENYDCTPAKRARTIEIRPVHSQYSCIQNVTQADVSQALARIHGWELRDDFYLTPDKLSLQKFVAELVSSEMDEMIRAGSENSDRDLQLIPTPEEAEFAECVG